MSRPLRIQFPDAWYHVMNRGRRSEDIFTGKNDYNIFIGLLKELVKDYKIKIAAYCLLSNHYQLLVQTPEANISRAMRHLNGVYTQRFNRNHHCVGNDTFIDEIKNRFFSSKRHEDVPETRFLAPDPGKIIKEVCKFYNISEQEIFSSRRVYFNEPRNVSIYLIRHLRGDTLKEVGELFEIKKNSTVSSVVERLKIETGINRKLKNRIENLKKKLTKSQE